MRVNDIRLKAPAQTDQSGEIASERKRVVVLALAYLRAPYAMRVQKRIVMTSGAGIDNSMPLPRLSAGEIDGDVDVPIRMLAMLDQMKNTQLFLRNAGPWFRRMPRLASPDILHKNSQRQQWRSIAETAILGPIISIQRVPNYAKNLRKISDPKKLQSFARSKETVEI